MDLDDMLPAQVANPQASRPKVWSPQQLAIYTHQETTSDAIIIEAVAGSGKSTTLEQLSRIQKGKALVLAFNKGIADELKSKIFTADVKTLNSLGHGIITRHRPGAKLNQWKSFAWLRQNMSFELFDLFGKEIVRCIGIAKGSAFGIRKPASVSAFIDVIDSYGLNVAPEHLQAAATLAHKAFQELTSRSESAEFDFDDQLYVPIAEGWTFPQYDIVYVDEAQDLNPIQHLILEALRSRGARIVAVGDRRQAIYGFRGALTNSMDQLSANFGMVEFPLSTTYRCCNAVVALAQSIVPQITARNDAPDGEVVEATEYPAVTTYRDGELIVCRNNAPIFEMALQFLKAKLPCKVMSNFMDEMDKFIESFKANDCKTLSDRLEAWYAKQKADCEERGAYGKLEGLTDRYEVVRRFAQEFQRVSDLLRAVRMLASATSGPRISTIHKAKGLEAEKVYLLRYDLLPSPRATKPEQVVQEENLRYVAITRAKNSLVILPKGEGQ